MTSSSPYLNVFEGTASLLDYYDPDKNAPTPLVEIPHHPFVGDNVRIFAKMMSFLPAANVKSLPALNMLSTAMEAGHFSPTETKNIVEYSSGSTVISLGILSRIYGVPNVHAYVSNKTSQTKLDLLRFFGLEITLFGGASQPEPLDPYGGIHVATVQGQKEGWFNPDQYSNPANPGAHERWTGPQILRQLPNISVFCASMGTSGTMTGTGLYLKREKPEITTIGVCTAVGERVPGPRTLALLSPVEFPWKEAVSQIEEVGTKESFTYSLDLCRHGVLAGPSSGLALRGLLKFLERTKRDDPEAFDRLRGPEGKIDCVFICCDLPFQYIGEYMQQLGSEHFPPIHNLDLVQVDTYPHRPEWEISPEAAATRVAQETRGSQTLVLDIRSSEDFRRLKVISPNCININIGNCGQPNPFINSATLATQWQKLNKLFGPQVASLKPIHHSLDEKERTKVICMCYDGNTARIATSILRARGIAADHVSGGYQRWISEALPIAKRPHSTPLLVKLKELLGF
ncbi:cysteine synthase B [Serendipita vermifera]|nr:cysteine synthase B [Serendipita vermifera]